MYQFTSLTLICATSPFVRSSLSKLDYLLTHPWLCCHSQSFSSNYHNTHCIILPNPLHSLFTLGRTSFSFLSWHNLVEDLQKHHPSTWSYSIIDKLMDGPPTPHNKLQPCQDTQNTSISTTFPDVPHSSSITTITAIYFTINTTIHTFTKVHQNT